MTLRTWWRRRPLTCPEVGRILQQHLDGELRPDLAARVDDHLEDCRRCGLQAATYLEIKQAVRRRGEPLPADAVDRLRTFAASLRANPDTPPES